LLFNYLLDYAALLKWHAYLGTDMQRQEKYEINDNTNFSLPSDKFVKIVRWDTNCFLEKFILGITKTPSDQFHTPLRQGGHKAYTVFASGVYKRGNKPSPYPTELLTKKDEFSQHQAMTLITDQVDTNVFGHDKIRGSKLIGFIFDPNDALINRMFSRDIGSFGRPYEFHSEKLAQEYYESNVLSDKPLLHSSYEAFKRAVIKQPNQCNEVLARVKWNDKSSAIGIFSDSFEARCVVQYYAERLKHRLKIQYTELLSTLEDDYEVPVYFYLPSNNLYWQPYSKQDQHKDKEYANSILDNEKLLRQQFESSNFEFLLIVSNPENVDKWQFEGESMLFWLIMHGQIHIADALLKRAGMPKSIEDIVADEFLNKNITQITLPSQKDSKTNILHIAAETGRLELFKLYAKLCPSAINELSDDGFAPIHYTAKYGHQALLSYLLTLNELNINLQDKNGWTTLHHAIDSDQMDIAKILLLDNRINANQRIKYCISPFHMAVASGSIDFIKLLLENPKVDSQAKVLIFFSPMKLAVEYKRDDVINLLTLDKLNKYLDALINREEEYKPRFGGLFWNGYSKSVKMQSANALKLHLLNETDNLDCNMRALKQGKLGDIVDALPSDYKNKLKL